MMSRKVTLIVYAILWLTLTWFAWDDKSKIGIALARLDVGSAVALALLAGYAFFEARKGDDFISITIQDRQGLTLDKIDTAVQRDHCSRSEIAGVLRSYHGDQSNYYKIKYLNSPEYREQLRQVMNGKTDQLVIKLHAGDSLASLMKEEATLGETLPNEGDMIFLNLSNHPIKEWEDEQVTAAHLLGQHDRLVDLAFPHVNPALSKQEVLDLAHGFWRNASAEFKQNGQTPKHALVAGEPIMCFALVQLLKKQGIECYAATTKRDSHYEGEHKVSKFRFVRFRAW